MDYYITGVLVFLYIQIGKKGMKKIKYHLELGETAYCTNRIMEAAKGLGQMNIKVATNDCFIFDSWLASNFLAETNMDIGDDSIGVAETNTKGFCKDSIKKIKNGCPGVF